jgi:hypothetical protein
MKALADIVGVFVATFLALVWFYLLWQDPIRAIGVAMVVLGLVGLGVVGTLYLVFGSTLWYDASVTKLSYWRYVDSDE